MQSVLHAYFQIHGLVDNLVGFSITVQQNRMIQIVSYEPALKHTKNFLTEGEGWNKNKSTWFSELGS